MAAGGQAGDLRRGHHHARLSAADGARGDRGAHVPADGDHRRHGAGGRARVHADDLPRGVRASFCARPKIKHKQGLLDRLATWYRRVLGRAMERPAPVLAAVGVALACTVPLGGVAGRGVRAAHRRGRVRVRHQAAAVDQPGRGDARSAIRSRRCWRASPRARRSSTRTGRAEVATDPVGFDEVETNVRLRPKAEWTSAHDIDELGEKMKTAIEREVPATFVSVSQPIEDRVNQLLSGSQGRPGDQGVWRGSADAQGARRSDRRRDARRARHGRPARAARARAAAARCPRRSRAHGPLRHPGVGRAGDGGSGARGRADGQGLRGGAALRRDGADAAADGGPGVDRRAPGRRGERR